MAGRMGRASGQSGEEGGFAVLEARCAGSRSKVFSLCHLAFLGSP